MKLNEKGKLYPDISWHCSRPRTRARIYQRIGILPGPAILSGEKLQEINTYLSEHTCGIIVPTPGTTAQKLGNLILQRTSFPFISKEIGAGCPH